MPDLLRDRLQTSLGTAYTIERELGGGGMSRVFLAEETRLGRQVVVKVLSPELAEGLSAERFAREIRLVAALQEPHIVPVLTAGITADGLPYYTMPFVRGESLRRRLDKGPVPLGEAAGILHDVARALAHAHRQGVVHRDVKPENVLLSEGTAVVTDFGIAKALSASRTSASSTQVPGTPTGGTLTRAGTMLGTPAYMAPEQAAGDDVDARADVYAWGVVAYELLAGAHPFTGRATAQQLIAAHLTEAPAPLSQRAPGVPAPLAALVMGCLEKDPVHRPQSAVELLTALDVGGTPSAVMGAPPSRATSRRVAPVVAPVAALLVVLVLAAGGYAWRARRAAGVATPPAAPAADTIHSLAVLPFATVGGDTANAYFAEGIADELAAALAKVPSLRVAGRGSAFRFRGRDVDVQEVGRALRVQSVLSGSVRRAGRRLRVSVDVANTSDGLSTWSSVYEHEAGDVFAVQDSITRAVVNSLRISLRVNLADGSPGRRDGAARGTASPEAYDFYLRGLYFYRRRGLELARAAEYMEQAIARDSNFARAHAALATALMTLRYYTPVPTNEVLLRAAAAAERALALDSGLADAHLALGSVHLDAFRWTSAEAAFRRATVLDPTLGETHFRHGRLLLHMGRIREGVAALERARTLDPLYAVGAAFYAHALSLAGRHDRALAEGQRAFDLDSTGFATYQYLALNYLAAGRPADALALTRRVPGPGRDVNARGTVGYVLARSGARDEARAILRGLAAMPSTTWRIHGAMARVHLGLGDTTAALTELERAADAGGELLPSAVTFSDPMYDPVRASPRFAEVLRRFNLDPSVLASPTGGRVP